MPEPKELQEHEGQDKDHFDKVQARIERIEKHLGLHESQKPKSKEERLRDRKRN